MPSSLPAGNLGDRSSDNVVKNPNGDFKTYVPSGPSSLVPASNRIS